MKTLFREVSINHVYAICHYLTAEISKPKASSESLTQPSGWVLIKSKYPDLAPLTYTHSAGVSESSTRVVSGQKFNRRPVS